MELSPVAQDYLAAIRLECELEPGTGLFLEAVTPVGVVEVVPDDADDSVATSTQIARRIGARATLR